MHLICRLGNGGHFVSSSKWYQYFDARSCHSYQSVNRYAHVILLAALSYSPDLYHCTITIYTIRFYIHPWFHAFARVALCRYFSVYNSYNQQNIGMLPLYIFQVERQWISWIFNRIQNSMQTEYLHTNKCEHVEQSKLQKNRVDVMENVYAYVFLRWLSARYTN